MVQKQWHTRVERLRLRCVCRLQVYHEHEDSTSGTVFRFDEENDHIQDPRILDSMLDVIGLSPLADEELSLQRGEEFAECVLCE